MHVKKGDTVMVVAGKDKGAVGKVIAAFPTQDRVIVEGVNLVKKHTKIGQTNRGAKTGGIKGALGVAEDRSEASIACRQVGPICFANPLPMQEEMFNGRIPLK